MPPQNPYAEFQKPLVATDPYAEFQKPLVVAPSRPAGLPAGVDLPQVAAHAPVAMQPSALGSVVSGANTVNNYVTPIARMAAMATGAGFGDVKQNAGPDDGMAGKLAGAADSMHDFGVGMAKSVPATLMNTAKLMPGASDAWQPLQPYAQTDGTAQNVGKAVGNAAQFLIPGGAEEKLGAYGASKLPMLGKFAAPVAQLGASALSAGAVNKAQGGSFASGAAGALAGGLVGRAAMKIAPAIAEGAMGIRAVDRAYGRTPGQAILDETTGYQPGTIAQAAKDKIGLYSNQLDNAAQQSTIPVNLQPARDTVNSFLATAGKRNNESTIKAIGKIGEQLDHRGNIPIPQWVSADEGLALKRGVGDLRSSWNPATATDLSNTAVDATQHAMHPELEAAIPQYRQLNSNISTLMPVAQRAAAKDLNAGVVQRTIARFGAHTGALVGASAGGALGYRHGGLPWAAAGATLGAVAPELIASPEMQMMAARSLYSPATRNAVLPALNGATQQAISLYGQKK